MSIVTHMKTTIDIADTLFEEAKTAAARDGTTFRALVEEGLRIVLGARHEKGGRFALRDASFKGKGLQPGVDLRNREAIASLTYEGRGG